MEGQGRVGSEEPSGKEGAFLHSRPGFLTSTLLTFEPDNYCFSKSHFFTCLWWGLAEACELLAEVCEISFPDQGSNLGPLFWEHTVLATGPPGKSAEPDNPLLWGLRP